MGKNLFHYCSLLDAVVVQIKTRYFLWEEGGKVFSLVKFFSTKIFNICHLEDKAKVLTAPNISFKNQMLFFDRCRS